MRAVRFAGALAVAVLVHAAATRLWPEFPRAFDLFLVVAVFHALDGNALAGALGGTAAGLVTDALTSGPYGLYGFTDTILGYSSAVLAQKLVVRRLSGVLVGLALAAAAQQAILIVLALLFVPASDLPTLSWAIARVGTAGVLGAVLFEGRKLLEARIGSWRRRRGAKLR